MVLKIRIEETLVLDCKALLVNLSGKFKKILGGRLGICEVLPVVIAHAVALMTWVSH